MEESVAVVSFLLGGDTHTIAFMGATCHVVEQAIINFIGGAPTPPELVEVFKTLLSADAVQCVNQTGV